MHSCSSNLRGNTRSGFPFSHIHTTNLPPQTLVERYNPLSSLTEQERIRKTANRVGLDVPKASTT